MIKVSLFLNFYFLIKVIYSWMKPLAPLSVCIILTEGVTFSKAQFNLFCFSCLLLSTWSAWLVDIALSKYFTWLNFLIHLTHYAERQRYVEIWLTVFSDLPTLCSQGWRNMLGIIEEIKRTKEKYKGKVEGQKRAKKGIKRSRGGEKQQSPMSKQ